MRVGGRNTTAPLGVAWLIGIMVKFRTSGPFVGYMDDTEIMSREVGKQLSYFRRRERIGDSLSLAIKFGCCVRYAVTCGAGRSVSDRGTLDARHIETIDEIFTRIRQVSKLSVPPYASSDLTRSPSELEHRSGISS